MARISICVEDMLYYRTSTPGGKHSKELLQKRFINVELIGQANWYLSTRINQLGNLNIELDQSRYCRSSVKKYLDMAGAKKVSSHHSTPLALDLIPTSEDGSIDLAMTRCDVTFAVSKSAKFSKRPGKPHFEAMLHVVRYLCNNSFIGIMFYSNMMEAPITRMLIAENIQQDHPFFTFSDSLCNDDVDSGRSIGCLVVVYMGGFIVYSSNFPDPVALSLAEAEYNVGCIAFIATSHLRMLLCEMGGISMSDMKAANVHFDSKSAIAISKSCHDTEHTMHILQWCHYVMKGVTWILL